MGLGSILGSISPAFGLASGQGMFGHLPLQQMGQSGLGGILGMILAGSGHQSSQSQQPSQGAMFPGTSLPVPQPLDHATGPTLQQYAQGMPGMAPQGGIMGQIGGALQANQGGHYPSGMQADQPMGGGGLAAILQSLGLT